MDHIAHWPELQLLNTLLEIFPAQTLQFRPKDLETEANKTK